MPLSVAELGRLSSSQLEIELRRCCGAEKWVAALSRRVRDASPPRTVDDLLASADRCFAELEREDWLEAFGHHPRIGDRESLRRRFATTADLASSEQAGSRSASDEELSELERLNRRYEEIFGYIFIVCATGKSAAEMLALLRARIENEPQDEIEIAAREQRDISRLRLRGLTQQ